MNKLVLIWIIWIDENSEYKIVYLIDSSIFKTIYWNWFVSFIFYLVTCIDFNSDLINFQFVWSIWNINRVGIILTKNDNRTFDCLIHSKFVDLNWLFHSFWIYWLTSILKFNFQLFLRIWEIEMMSCCMYTRIWSIRFFAFQS